MVAAGRLRETIVFERLGAAAPDEYGYGVEAWTPVYTARAEVRYGTGEERRAAAQEVGTQAATFIIRRNPTSEALLLTDRIAYFGGHWDISSIEPVAPDIIEITAARAA